MVRLITLLGVAAALIFAPSALAGQTCSYSNATKDHAIWALYTEHASCHVGQAIAKRIQGSEQKRTRSVYVAMTRQRFTCRYKFSDDPYEGSGSYVTCKSGRSKVTFMMQA